MQASTNPNGSAYTTLETRNGIPLDYVGEKLRKAVEAAHDNLQNIKRHIPDDLPMTQELKNCGIKSIKSEFLIPSAVSALDYSLNSYLALHNMLATMNSPGIVQTLEKLSTKELTQWLDRVEQEAKVLG